jgi:hypothetical protein
MTGRILRIELRRSAAPPLALIIIGVGTILEYVFVGRHGWWLWQAVAQRAMLGLVFPLAIGGGAWQALRERRSTMDELIASTPLPRWRRVVPTALAIAIAVVVGYVAMFVIASGKTIPYATYFPVGTVPVVAVGVLAMIAAAWLGLAGGSRWPSTLTPLVLGVIPAVLILGFNPLRRQVEPTGAALYLPSIRGSGNLLMEFTTPTVPSQVAQAIWLAGLAAAGFIVFTATSRRGRLLAIAPLALGAALALPFLPAKLSGAFVVDRQAVEQVCTADAPRVCVPRAHESALDSLKLPARQALAILATQLPNAPTSVTETYEQPTNSIPETVLITALRVSGDHFVDPPEDIVAYLLDGAGTVGCPNLGRIEDPDGDRYIAARLAATAWLTGQPPVGPPGLEPDPAQALDTLRAMPLEEQRSRVAALRSAEVTCAPGDRLDILIGPR